MKDINKNLLVMLTEGIYEQENLVDPLGGTDKKIVVLSSIAVFKVDKLKGDFDQVETRGYISITGKIKQRRLVISMSEEDIKPKNKIANTKMVVNLLTSSCQLGSELNSGQIRFNLKIRSNVQI